MKKYVLWLAGIVLLVLLFAGAFILYHRLSADYAPEGLVTEAVHETQENDRTAEENTSEKKTAAPDFTVLDGAGNTVHLSDYFGAPIVLNFWASWCPPCKEEMPDFDAAYQTYDNVQFLMINMTDGNRETIESAKTHVAQEGYTFPVFYDTALHAANAYQAYSLPMTFFIDKAGNLIAHAVGKIDAQTLERGITMILPEM